VLHVDAKPVETGVRHHLGGEAMRDGAPASYRRLAFAPQFLDSVESHGSLPSVLGMRRSPAAAQLPGKKVPQRF
jgi:hypothetical protein